MILLDTNVLIEILKGNQTTVRKIESFEETIALSSISAMELFYGALDKKELKKLEQFIALFHTIHLDEEISVYALNLIKKYAKSHGLDIPDSLIASTALVQHCRLMTYNQKDFRYIDGLELL